MNSHTTNTNAVSPVLAVILMIGVTVILSAAIGILVLDLGQATTTQEPRKLGVTITEHEPGTVSINTKTGSTDSLRVLVNDEERVNQSVKPGSSINVSGVPEDARISIIDSSGSSDQVVVSQEVSNGLPFAETPVDLASIHAGMSTTDSGAFIITNVYELQAISTDLSAEYVLGTDIQASSTQYWNDGGGFTPIGDDSNNFTGSLDGDGYVIDGLYINRSSTEYVGLLGESEGSVTNLGVVNADVTGATYLGGLVGSNDGDVTSSYSTGSVTGTGDLVGGLVGKNAGTVTSSYSTGSVSSDTGVAVGGLVGYSVYATVTSSYSTGSVTGTEFVGGLVGYNFGGTVTSSYSTGSVNGDTGVGGLTGYNTGSVTSSYWDEDSSGQSSSDGGTGLETSEMTGLSAESSMSGFDFGTTWSSGSNSEYPVLVWESE